MKPENISAGCGVVGTVLLSLLLLEKKTSCSVPLNLKHQSHPHKPYDTLIVDTLEPGQEPRQHHRRKGKELFLVQHSLDKNTSWCFHSGGGWTEQRKFTDELL